MKIYVTGGAGFIGSNLCTELVKKNYQVIAIDNLSTGNLNFIKHLLKKKNFKFFKINLNNKKKVKYLFSNKSVVVHLAANADVRYGIKKRDKDIKENIIVTSNVLESCIFNKVNKIIFASTGSVYGDAKIIPTAENYSYPIQTSLYANSKNAAEGLITTYSNYFGLKYTIFRFVSVLGKNYTHGHVRDFLLKLKKNKNSIKILGNGLQKKSYLHVNDCVDAILQAIKKKKYEKKILNLGTNEWITVNQSLRYICNYLKINPKVKKDKTKSGWPGDNPKILLKISKIKNLGWKPKKKIKESILDTVKFLTENKKFIK